MKKENTHTSKTSLSTLATPHTKTGSGLGYSAILATVAAAREL